MGETTESSSPTRAVARALDLLLSFSHEEPELTLTQLSARVGIHKSTVYRLLATLESERFVLRDPATNKYRLGTRLVELAALVAEHNDIQRCARPYLYRLLEEYRETVNLAVLDGDRVIYLEQIESPQRVRLAARPGQRLALYSTASGKAFLAFMPEGQAERLLVGELIQYTAYTLHDRERLWDDLRATRQRGFAIATQELEDGINAVAAPVLDPDRMPIAAIAMAGPSFRHTWERMIEVGPAVRAAADGIAREVGALSKLRMRPNG